MHPSFLIPAPLWVPAKFQLHFRSDDGIVTRAEESFLSATRNPKNRCKKTAEKSYLGEEILVDTCNSSLQFGRSSAPSTSHKKKRKKEGNSLRNFVFRVRVSGILVVIICLFVFASSCVL